MKGKLIIIFLSILIGLGVTYSFAEEPKAEDIQKEIAQKVLRFHVLANSDSEEDQALKLKVKEAVVEYLTPYLDREDITLSEAKSIVEERMTEIILLSETIIRENGYDYTVQAELVRDYFPVKAYGDVTFPAGEYEAFRITIGEAEGKNWWCILYPPLCFVDVTYGYVPEDKKKTLENVLEKEAYEMVVNGEMEDMDVEVQFKFLELIKDLFN